MDTALAPEPLTEAPQAPGKPPINSLAAVALALAFVTLIGGIVCGHVALAQIHATGERGRGLAVAALVIGYGEVVAALALIVGLPLTALLLGAHR